MELLQAAAQQVPRGTADRRLVLNREPLELLLERPGMRTPTCTSSPAKTVRMFVFLACCTTHVDSPR